MEIFDKNIDDLVKVLKDHGQIPEPEFNNMINHSILYNSTQHLILGMLPNIMKTESPTTVVGDIHGFWFHNSGNFMICWGFLLRRAIPHKTNIFFWGIMLIGGISVLK